MIGWILFIVLAVLIVGLLAQDRSPQEAFREGWVTIRSWYRNWRRRRG